MALVLSKQQLRCSHCMQDFAIRAIVGGHKALSAYRVVDGDCWGGRSEEGDEDEPWGPSRPQGQAKRARTAAPS